MHVPSEEPFWQLPPAFEATVRDALPSEWHLDVCREPKSLRRALAESHAFIGWPFASALVRRAPHLRWVHFLTSGVPESWQRIARDHATLRVTRARGVNGRSVAEHALMLLLTSLRGMRPGALASWSPESWRIAKSPENQTLTIVGYGAIGQALVPLVRPLFGQVRVVSHTARAATDTTPEVQSFPDAQDAFRASDAIVIAVPMTPESRAMFDADRFFPSLRDDVLVVNVARGALIDEPALLRFLEAHPEATYATDVASPEPYPDGGALWSSPQVLVTPHLAGRRNDVWDRLAEDTVERLPEGLAHAARGSVGDGATS